MEAVVTAFLVAVLGLATAAITQLRAKVQAKVDEIQAKVGPDKLQTAINLARYVVQAAEKLIPGSGNGADKYEFAQDALIELASKVNLDLSPTEASAIIHAVLKELDDLTAIHLDAGVVAPPVTEAVQAAA